MLTKVSALELGEYNIRVNAIGPGHTETPLTARARDVDGFDEGNDRRNTARPSRTAE